MEAMYQYQLEMVEKQVEYERLQILEDINVTLTIYTFTYTYTYI